MMKRTAWLTFGAMMSAGADAADLNARGGFNGWGTDNLLSPKGKGVYQARATLSPGNHPFKVGSGDLPVEWTGAPEPPTK